MAGGLDGNSGGTAEGGRLSFRGEENILELERGGVYTTLPMYSMPLNGSPENGYFHVM